MGVHRILFWVGWINLTVIHSVWAEAFRSPLQDSAAMAQGNAFRAQADNPSAIYYNPAGTTQLTGIQHSFGIQFVNLNTQFRSASGDRIENDLGNIIGLPPPGQLFITGNLQSLNHPLLTNITLGLGIQSLYGFSTKYPENGPFASVMTRAQLPLLNIKPTIAYKLNQQLSLGFGIDIFTFASFLGGGHSEQESIAAGNIPDTLPGQKLELNGSGTTVGYNFSLLWTPWVTETKKPRINVGFIWRSQAELPLNGELRADGRKVANTETALRFPESYEWGIAIWPVRAAQHEWKVEVDVDYVQWSSIRDFDTKFSNGMILHNPQNWDDTFTLGVGSEWKWIKPVAQPNWTYALRAGYIRSHSPVPDRNLNPAFPDSNLHGITTGIGFICHGGGKILWLISCGNMGRGVFFPKAMTIDLAYLALLYESRKVSGNLFMGINGRYETTTHAGSITFKMDF